MSTSEVAARLAAAGCVAAEEEAGELLSAAAGDVGTLAVLTARRIAGEPLAWVTGRLTFFGGDVAVDAGVFVPRPQSEALARRAAELLPPDGLAADLCTGSGAIALALMRARPSARVLASDIEEAACNCARRNGVDAYCGDLAEPLPAEFVGLYDVVVAVVPYVPSDEIAFLPRDSRLYEPAVALDGGEDGTTVLRRAARAATSLLRPGGALLLELGGDEGETMTSFLRQEGFAHVALHHDDDGDLRFIEAFLPVERELGASAAARSSAGRRAEPG